MTGSEGTLGIFTKIILKVIPRPRFQHDLLASFRHKIRPRPAFPAMITGSGITPVSIGVYGRHSVSARVSLPERNAPVSGCRGGSLGLGRWERPGELADQCEALGVCLRQREPEIYVADTKAESERIWKIRRSIPGHSVWRFRGSRGRHRCSIRLDSRGGFKCRELAKKYKLVIPCYGHAGTSVHSRICAPAEWSDAEWDATLPVILRELYAEVTRLGGRISGEHGIGCKRRPYMKEVVSKEFLDTLRAIKKAIDPNGIMNPGKIF